MSEHKYSASILKGRRWLLDHVREDGSLKGATHIGHYYKVPAALLILGSVYEAESVLDYTAENYLKEDGDLDGSGCPYFADFRIYPHTWLSQTSIQVNRFDISAPLVRTIKAFRHKEDGGFSPSEEARDAGHIQEVLTTSLAGLSCLAAGDFSAALKTGEWLEKVFREQPDLKSGLLVLRHPDRGLLRNEPKFSETYGEVSCSTTEQYYYHYGCTGAFLSCLYGAVKDKRWLDLARNYLYASRNCMDDVYSLPSSGKIGWGASWIYRYTHDAKELEIARRVHGEIRDLQKDNGSWEMETVYDKGAEKGEKEPPLDLTAEMIFHLACIENIHVQSGKAIG